MQIIHTNSRTSTHWKLNVESGKVQAAIAADTSQEPEDPLLSLLTNKVLLENGEWRLEGEEPTCNDSCQKTKSHTRHEQKQEKNNTKKGCVNCVGCRQYSSVL